MCPSASTYPFCFSLVILEMADQAIQRWMTLAAGMINPLDDLLHDFDIVSTEYADVRDAAFNNDELKEQIDTMYSTIVDKKNAFCQMQAGGKRRRTRRTRRTRR